MKPFKHGVIFFALSKIVPLAQAKFISPEMTAGKPKQRSYKRDSFDTFSRVNDFTAHYCTPIVELHLRLSEVQFAIERQNKIRKIAERFLIQTAKKHNFSVTGLVTIPQCHCVTIKAQTVESRL